MVWRSEITYIPLRRGFTYLVAPVIWHSREVLSWRISNTLDTDFCVMDGRCTDNIFIERLLWTVKYHYLHLQSFENGFELQKGLRSWFEYYNRERTHQSLGMTPDECYFREQMKQAA